VDFPWFFNSKTKLNQSDYLYFVAQSPIGIEHLQEENRHGLEIEVSDTNSEQPQQFPRSLVEPSCMISRNNQQKSLNQILKK
jgi:hypothetical protein